MVKVNQLSRKLGAVQLRFFLYFAFGRDPQKYQTGLYKKLSEKADMNCGLVRSDFVDCITKSAMELR